MSGNPWPFVFPDGSWEYTDAPSLVVATDAPAQASPNDGRINWYGAGPSWQGPIEVHHIVNIPPVIPNVGVPGTDFNISSLFMGGLFQDFVAQTARTLGGVPLAVAIYEYRQPGSFLGQSFDMLGYEVVLMIEGSPVQQAQAQWFGAQPEFSGGIFPVVIGAAVLIGAVIAGLPAWAALVAAGVSLDILTGGAVSAALGGMVDKIAKGASTIVKSPATGATEVLLVGIGAVFALSWFLGKQEQRGTKFDFTAARGITGAAGELTKTVYQPTGSQLAGAGLRTATGAVSRSQQAAAREQEFQRRMALERERSVQRGRRQP